MSDQLREVAAHVVHFERVKKGEKPTVFKESRKGIPGDGIFATVYVDGVGFAVTVICMHQQTPPQPYQFECALRGAHSALIDFTGGDQPEDVSVHHVGEMN